MFRFLIEYANFLSVKYLTVRWRGTLQREKKEKEEKINIFFTQNFL